MQTYKIEKGHYGGVPLDNLIVVVSVVSPEGKIMDQSAGQSVLLALYVDRSDRAAQCQAVEEIWRHSFLHGFEGEKGGVKAVKFQRADLVPDRAVVTIPGILAFDVQKGSSQQINVQDPYIRNLRVARPVHYRYSDYGMAWKYPGRHAALAAFHAQSPPSRQGDQGLRSGLPSRRVLLHRSGLGTRKPVAYRKKRDSDLRQPTQSKNGRAGIRKI